MFLKEHSANRSTRRPSWLFFVFEFVNLVVLFLQFAECSFKVRSPILFCVIRACYDPIRVSFYASSASVAVLVLVRLSVALAVFVASRVACVG